MNNIYSKLLIFFCWSIISLLCGTVKADITGNASLSYDLIKENGNWFGESEQRVNINMRGRTGLDDIYGLSFGFIRHEGKIEPLGGLAPTYALNLRGKYYSLSSGYSVRVYKDIVNSQIYENFGLFLPSLPAFRLTYTRQGINDSLKEHEVNSNTNNIQLQLEDDIGPFRISLNKRNNTLRDLVRGSEYDVKTSNTSGGIDFAYSYRQLFSLNGEYGLGQLITEQEATGDTKSKVQDFTIGFRVSPLPTIALSGTTTGRRELRESSEVQVYDTKIKNDSLTNRLQLMLQPLNGILLNLSYLKDDADRNNAELFSNENKSLTVNLEPWRNFSFIGYFTDFNSQRQGIKLSTLRGNSFDFRMEPIEGLQLLSRLDLSKSENLVSGVNNSRSNLTTSLEVMPTENLRTDVSYDWQRFNTISEDRIDKETQHRLMYTVNYFFFRMLDFDFRIGKSISSVREGSNDYLVCGLNYMLDESARMGLRYNRVSSYPLSGEGRRVSGTLKIEFEQKVNQATLFLSYEDRFGGYSEIKNLSFRINIVF